MTRHVGLKGIGISCALLLSIGLASQSEAAAARATGNASSGKATQISNEKLSLYVEQVAFMLYCGIAIDDAAVGKTLTAVGLKGASIPSVKSQAAKLVPQLDKLNGPGRFDFCKRAKTIPIVQAWSAKQ